VISDERVTSTDDPRSDVVFDLVFDIAWPISAAYHRRRTTVRRRPPMYQERSWQGGSSAAFGPLVLLRQRRDLSRLRSDVRTGGLVKRADVRRVLAQRALQKPR
jgi:hypothetical protein